MAHIYGLLDQLPKVRGTYREHVDLSNITWFRVGGPAEVVFRPADTEDLIHFLKEKPEGIPVTVIGVCSNLLIRDGGIDGVVIRLGRSFASIQSSDHHVIAGAVAMSFNVSLAAQQAGISGLEFLSGIPGTIGGALAMNAGCYGSDISSHLVTAKAVDDHGDIHELQHSDFGFIYRGNTLPDNWIFTEATLKGEREHPDIIAQRIADITAQREASQPIKTATGGSTFRNPEGHKAWKLIDEAGCRGLQIGGAIMSEKHCNFLVNQGDATASDLENLGEEVRERVYKHSGVTLEWEIHRIGKKTS